MEKVTGNRKIKGKEKVKALKGQVGCSLAYLLQSTMADLLKELNSTYSFLLCTLVSQTDSSNSPLVRKSATKSLKTATIHAIFVDRCGCVSRFISWRFIRDVVQSAVMVVLHAAVTLAYRA